MLRSDDWAFVSDVSGLSVGPIFKGHSLNLEEWTNTVSSNVGL